MDGRRLFSELEDQFVETIQDLSIHIQEASVDLDSESFEISIHEARCLLSDFEGASHRQSLIWKEIARKSQSSDAIWVMAATWIMLPRLRMISARLCRNTRIESGEVDAEVLASFTEVIKSASPERENLGAHLWWGTYRRADRSLKVMQRDIPVEDVEIVGAIRSSEDPDDVITNAINDEISASKKLTTFDCRRIEGERLGGVVQRLGIYDQVIPWSYSQGCTPQVSATKRKLDSSNSSNLPSDGADTVHPYGQRQKNEINIERRGRNSRAVSSLTFPELLRLPVVIDLRTAADAVGVSINTAYKLVHEDRFPCPVLRPGHRYKVPTAGLMRCLGIESTPVDIDDVRAGAAAVHNDA